MKLEVTQERGELYDLVLAWLAIDVPVEQRRFVEKHLELLDPESDRIMSTLVDALEADSDWAALQHRLKILQDARERGGTMLAVRQAYINHSAGLALDLPVWLETIIQKVEATSDKHLRQELFQEALASAQEEANELEPEILAELGYWMAHTLLELSNAHAEALLLYEQVLQVYTRDHYPLQYARVIYELASVYYSATNVYQHLTSSERELYLARAVACYDDALTIWTRQAFAGNWMKAQADRVNALLDRYPYTGKVDDLEQAITVLNDLLRSKLANAPAILIILINLIRALYLRWSLRGQMDDLEQSLRLGYMAREYCLSSGNMSDFSVLLNSLGMILRSRYTVVNDRQDLEQSIEALEEAIDYAPANDTKLSTYRANLSIGILLRYYLTQQMPELEKALQMAQTAVEDRSAPALQHAFACFVLGSCLMYRYAHTGQPEELDKSIEVLEEARQQTPQFSPDLPIYFAVLSQALMQRNERTARPEDIERGIEESRRTLADLPPDAPLLPYLLCLLSSYLMMRYQYDGQQEDAREAIVICHRALKMSTKKMAIYPVLLTNLGASLLNRYLFTGSSEDVEEAIRCNQDAVAMTPANSPNLPFYQMAYASALRTSYIYTGKQEAIKKAIDVLQEAQELAAANSPLQRHLATQLAVSLEMLYEFTGHRAYLDRAIGIARHLLQLYSSETTHYYIYLFLLSRMLGLAYASTGKQEDLKEMLEVSMAAIEHAPPRSPLRSVIANSRFASLLTRHERTGSLEDLDAAIALSYEAVTLSANSALYPEMLNSLGMSLMSRSLQTGNLKEMEQAITHFEESIECTPPNSPDRSIFLFNLSTGLLFRSLASPQREGLERVIETMREMISATSMDHPMWLSYTNRLVIALSIFSEHTGTLAAQEEAVERCRQALEHATQTSPLRAPLLQSYAVNMIRLYTETGSVEYKRQAIQHYEEACQKGLVSAVDVALSSAGTWGKWAMERIDRDWEEAAHAYSFAVQALGLLYREQLLRASKQVRLADAMSWDKQSSDMVSLYDQAAYAQARAGQLREAVTSLELGRARGLGEALARDRADLEDLEYKQKDLYDRYMVQIGHLQRLENADLMGSAPLHDEKMGIVTLPLAEQMRQARAALEETILAIRLVPGYSDFLLEPTYQKIVQAALPGVPLLYITTTSAGSMALLVTAASEEPEVIWADDFTWDKLLLTKYEAGKLAGGYIPGQLVPAWMRSTLTESLPNMGHDLVRLMAQCLREHKATGVVLIPTGSLGMLPFHAAPYWRERQEICLLDEFDVAYTPSARVLTTVRHEARTRRAGSSSQHLVGVGNPLPDVSVGVWAKGELQRIFSSLQQHIETGLPLIKDSISPHKKARSGQTTTEFWLHALKRVQVHCEQPPEILIERGESLRELSSLFADFPALPEEVDATLKSVSQRIPPGLDYARTELESIQSFLAAEDVVTLYGTQATRDALWQELPQASIVHLSCHGSFDARSPLDSAFLLARETKLTLRDLFEADAQQLAHLQLAVLSACQTAVTDVQELPNEATGLLSGFLHTGVPAVIGTLWSVGEVSTALLMIRFYELYLYGDTQLDLTARQPLTALRLAQRWLRDLTNQALLNYLDAQARRGHYHLSARLRTHVSADIRADIRANKGEEVRPYAHAYHWAAFVYYGAW